MAQEDIDRFRRIHEQQAFERWPANTGSSASGYEEWSKFLKESGSRSLSDVLEHDMSNLMDKTRDNFVKLKIK